MKKIHAYLLKIDWDLWKQARKKAIDLEVTLKEVIADFLRRWVEEKERKGEGK